MILNKVQKIHLVGIGGIGLSAIARLFLKMRKAVTGSDVADSLIIQDLKKLGANIKIGHYQKNLEKDVDLLIYSTAVPVDNAERMKATKLKIPQLSYPQILGELMKNKYGIAISGTNGKTTVTAMIGLILTKASFDPTVVVGSQVKEWQSNARLGQSKYLIAEACEYQAHMLELSPQTIILTNIEKDHLDYYKDLKDIIKHFQKFINKLPKDGMLILNNDDKNISRLKIPTCPIVTYGIDKKSDLMAKNIKIEKFGQAFNLIWKNKSLGDFFIPLPSRFNIYNALAATAFCLSLGIDSNIIKDFFRHYQGLWRRFERIGEINGAPIISDYAHLPTSLSGTIRGARDLFPNKRIVAVFQPHQYARTKKLFKEFSRSFNEADLIILNEIYYVEGREEKNYKDISSADLVKEINKRNKKAIFTKDLKDTYQNILSNLKKDDLILILGAGDIYKVGEWLIKKNEFKER